MNFRTLLQHVGLHSEATVRSLGRTILLAALVGVAAGLGAIAFQWLCNFSVYLGQELAAGYHAGGPAGEQVFFESEPSPLRPWLLLVVIVIGALGSSLLVYGLAPEAEGHGTDAAIDAYHNKRGVIHWRVPVVKMFSSALTLGSGGSGGREGPIAQIGAGFGSFLGTVLHLPDSQRRSLMAAGIGAGIGAIFHAPLAGAIFACEVLYRDTDFEAENIIPAFIATTVAYAVFSLAFGIQAFAPLFLVSPDNLVFTRPFVLLLPLAVLAVTMAAAAWVYVQCLYGVHRLFKRFPIANVLKPVIGAFLTGTLALTLFFVVSPLGEESQKDSLSVLSFGYGFLQKVLNPPVGEQIAIWLLLIVGLGKIVTTSLTIGSGGSGGVFGPSMVIGGSLGAVVGLVFHRWLPGVVGQTDVVIFTILGMAGFFAAAANTPVSTLIMVSEMCSSYVLLLPSMWVCALAYLLSGRTTLYVQQVATRRDSPAHRGDFIVDVLEGLTVRDAIPHATTAFEKVPLDMPLREMSKLLTDTRQTCFPVVDGSGNYFGLFSLNDIRQFLYDSPVADLAVAADLANTGSEPLTLQLDLSSAINRFTDGNYEELPVVDAGRPLTVVGLLRRQDLIATYSMQLLAMRRGHE